MAYGKWLSLASGLVSAAVVAALLLYVTSLAGPRVNTPLILSTSLATAALVAIVHWLVLTRHHSELRRVIAYTESLGDEGQSPRLPALQPGQGLEAVTATIHHTVGGLRHRLDRTATQRRELEVQMRISDAERRHAQAILNALVDAVIVTDVFNEVVMVNDAAERLFGFDRADAVRRPVEQVVGDPTLVKLIRDARQSADPRLRRHVEHSTCRKDQAATAVFDVALAGLRDERPSAPADEIAGVVTILRDITREKEISEMKSDFVSNVSHELRTPLSSIRAYMEMLVDGEATDDQTHTEFYNIIQGETNRLSRLIDNILNISRIEAGAVKVQREHLSLSALAQEAVEVMQAQARARNIQLSLTPCPNGPRIVADKDMIYQAVMNLISNAVKYTPPDGSVTVAVETDAARRWAKVSVADTGVGVPAEDLPHLFQKFYRVKDHKNMAKGTGLGLNLVKHIVETVHGGRVGLSSQPHQGSTFWFTLPLSGVAA